jgi:hypothetical protein
MTSFMGWFMTNLWLHLWDDLCPTYAIILSRNNSAHLWPTYDFIYGIIYDHYFIFDIFMVLLGSKFIPWFRGNVHLNYDTELVGSWDVDIIPDIVSTIYYRLCFWFMQTYVTYFMRHYFWSYDVGQMSASDPLSLIISGSKLADMTLMFAGMCQMKSWEHYAIIHVRFYDFEIYG